VKVWNRNIQSRHYRFFGGEPNNFVILCFGHMKTSKEKKEIEDGGRLWWRCGIFLLLKVFCCLVQSVIRQGCKQLLNKELSIHSFDLTTHGFLTTYNLKTGLYNRTKNRCDSWFLPNCKCRNVAPKVV
jgi:hypothetical protein